MMRFVVTQYDGRRFELPQPLRWRLDYACGVPCDSFSVTLPWKEGEEKVYSKAVELTAWHREEQVFAGVVDEAEWGRSRQGGRATLTGRSLAARLLDNEALAADYAAATLEDVLRDHVTPYGIQCRVNGNIPVCQNFSISSGSSEWQVVYDFVRYHGGLPPRFDRQGRLVVAPFGDDAVKMLDDSVPLLSLTGRERRYGVLSEILVRDKQRQVTDRVVNGAFQAQGGQARRVLTLNRSLGERARRYNAQFQLDKSAARQRRVEMEVPTLFFAWPGDLVRIQRTNCGENGLWRVLEAVVEKNENGGTTRLVLGEPDVVI